MENMVVHNPAYPVYFTALLYYYEDQGRKAEKIAGIP
jgi:hypothetical protein